MTFMFDIAVRAPNLSAIPAAVRREMAAIDPSLPPYDVKTLQEALADSISSQRFNLFLLGSFALAAFVLALVGLYGVVTYSVAARQPEIGVRVALGAQRANVIGMVVREGMTLGLAEIIIGLAASYSSTRLMTSLLYGVKASDPRIFAAASAALALTVLFASWWPARNASTIEPVSRLARRIACMTRRFLMFQAPVAEFLAVTAWLIFAIPVFAQPAVVHEKDIVKAIVDQFDQSDLVALGEIHGCQADQDLRFQIIHNRAFAERVHIIVVEGLNALYREDLDRYIRGEDTPLRQVQRVWRDSTGIFIGPVILTSYQQFLTEVRAVNRGLPDRLKLRVIAADPPLDWAKVQSPADFRSILGKRVEFGAEVIERETIRKGQKTLLVFASAWFTRNKQHRTANGLVPWIDTIGGGLDRDFPGRLYVIASLRSGKYPVTATLQESIGTPASPVLLRLHGIVFGSFDANEFGPANASGPNVHSYIDGTTMAQVADAVIYRAGCPTGWFNRILPMRPMQLTRLN
jgi:hypothetical protein